jgi:hypothetical protein
MTHITKMLGESQHLLIVSKGSNQVEGSVTLEAASLD